MKQIILIGFKLLVVFCFFLYWGDNFSTVAQTKQFSSSEVLKRYLKATGGEKALKTIRDTTYSGNVWIEKKPAGQFQLSTQAPNCRRFEIKLDTDNQIELVNGSSVWEQTTRTGAITLLDEEARQIKAETVLFADRKLDYKGQAFTARSIPVIKIDDRMCSGIEFVSRQRAQIRMYVDTSTWLLARIESGAGDTLRRFDFFDFSPVDGIQEPHRIEFTGNQGSRYTLNVERVQHNANLAATTFNPPKTTESVDVKTLLAAVEANQKEVDERVTNYTYLLTETQQELDKDGQVKETKVNVYEVFPLPGNERVRKLVSVNGKPLSANEAEKEQKRVAKFVLENEKRQQKKKANSNQENDHEKKHEITIGSFLQACEFYNPRRETLRGRNVMVCDFRPKPNFKPKTEGEKVTNKLSGTIWIDDQDKEVSRLEGRFDNDYKVGGGLVASLKRGAAFTFEQTRMAEGVWLPLLADFNAGIKIFLVAGLNISVENRYSEYKRFSVTTKIDLENNP